MKILITGGTGKLGRALAGVLRQAGHLVAVTSRSATEEPGVRRLDVHSDASWNAAVTDAEVIVLLHHDHTSETTAEVGTELCIQAAKAHRVHNIVYLSRVGAEQVPSAQWIAADICEQVLAENTAPYSIIRSTMLHSTVFEVANRLHHHGRVRIPGPWPTQSIADESVIGRLAQVIVSPPAQRLPDIAGPHREGLAAICRAIHPPGTVVFEADPHTELDYAFANGFHLPPRQPSPNYPGAQKLGPSFVDWLHTRQRRS